VRKNVKHPFNQYLKAEYEISTFYIIYAVGCYSMHWMQEWLKQQFGGYIPIWLIILICKQVPILNIGMTMEIVLLKLKA
jgi:hypothetical protein